MLLPLLALVEDNGGRATARVHELFSHACFAMACSVGAERPSLAGSAAVTAKGLEKEKLVRSLGAERYLPRAAQEFRRTCDVCKAQQYQVRVR